MLRVLESVAVRRVVHVSSVASIDGAEIEYHPELSCDDAYRATKYLQEQLVTEWCLERDIECYVVYPSAIFSSEGRQDTNIETLQAVSSVLPVIPRMDTKKSLTSLDALVGF